MSDRKRRINCQYCDYHCYDPDDIVSHYEKSHDEMIPDGVSPWHFYTFLKTGKMEGKCIVCNKPTTFNESTHKYNRFCGRQECYNKYRETFKNRMIGKYGKTTLLNDPEMQKKMLANRSISGVYVWRDKVSKTPYTGSYEKSFLEFLDNVLEFDPRDVFAPSPHTYYYEYNGGKHFYIPDFFIGSLNLEVEIKDGGDNPNTHHKILEVDKVKEQLKDEVMKGASSAFNYIKIVNKDNKKLLKYLEEAKYNTVNNIKGNIVML